MATFKDNNTYDVIVVGAGPAGSACSAFLCAKGKSVLLLDKATFPRDKTCGDGISGKSMRVLKEMGLISLLDSIPHGTVTGVILSSPDGTEVQIPIPGAVEGSGHGYCIRREIFDNELFKNAKKKGAITLENFLVTDLVMDGTMVKGVKGKGHDGLERTFNAKVVVGADGANGVVNTKLIVNNKPVKDVKEEHWCTSIRTYFKGVKGMTPNIELHFVEGLMPGYFWIFPLDNGMANVGAGMVNKDMQEMKVSLKDATIKVITESPKFKARFEGATPVGPWKGWVLPFGSNKWPVAGDGWVLVGDAASLVDPFTGEGIGNALLSGKLAAETISKALEAGDISKGFLMEYENNLRTTVDSELQNSYRMQRLGTHKWLLNLCMQKAARNPEVREAIADTLLDAKNRKKFLDPFFYLRLLVS